MVKRPQLDMDQQAQKLTEATRLAKAASKSEDVAARLGALVLYAGIVDYCAIMSARMVEQTILKFQISFGHKPMFKPHEDEWFYSHKVSTRTILKGIRRYLPFHANEPGDAPRAARATAAATRMIDLGLSFLANRDTIVHHIGNPNQTLPDMLKITDSALKTFPRFTVAYSEFVMEANHFRLTAEQYRQVSQSSEGEQTGRV